MAVAKVVSPSLKPTRPVGMPVDCAPRTVAVKVTVFPKMTGLAEEVTTVIVAAKGYSQSVLYCFDFQ